MNKKINNKLLEIYNSMLIKVGTRNWWPSDTEFETIVGAILTQFVAWKNVTLAINNLKNEKLLSIEGIYNANNEKLEELIRCTRFYKQKARRLKEFCAHIVNKYNGDLEEFFDKDINALRDELLSLYGIGEETADCIILYAAYKPIFVVDAYTRRIFSRLGYFKEDISYKDMQKFFMDNLENRTAFFNEYHAQIDGIGSHYCYSKNPDCINCPLNKICKWSKENE
ncbi:MAG: endonuclease III domain-containing protein [Bacillota bacterium]|nr:endonuclease III domain-containing protein [Bacillota bacterium]